MVIVQRRLTHYRAPLFDALRTRLQDSGVALDLAHGQPAADELVKKDAGSLAWATRINNRYVWAGGKYLCWQPITALVRDANLVIVSQENSLLSNYPLLAKGPRRLPHVAFWGHGGNLQSRRRSGPREQLKRWTSSRAHWWFAYTRLSADLVVRHGVDPSRITILNNAIDTAELRSLRASVGAEELAALRRELKLGDGPVGIFLGSLYHDKRLPFLMDAARLVRRAVPKFELLLIGDGPERERVRRWAATAGWIRWVGALRGRAKARYAALGDVMLNPGLVGLNVLDAFALGVPIVTTQWPYHSPEFAYLKHGMNGIVAPDDLASYVDSVVGLLRDDAARRRLQENCRQAAGEYTLDDMVRRFTHGILAALEAQDASNLECGSPGVPSVKL